MTTSKKFRPWRRLAGALEAVIILGIPFLKINGESALRFDIPSLRLHFFGLTLWMEEFFILLIAVIFLTFFFLLITLLFGRIWCGWLCPQTVISDLTRFAEKAKGLAYKLGAYSAVFLISVIVSANLIWYFIDPYEFIPQAMEGRLGDVTWGFWITLTGIIFLNFILLRQRFCATICPYAKLQGVMYDDKTLVIAFDTRRKEECMDCGACVKACPVNIDIREGMSNACINCAQCIDECADMMGHRERKSLISYFFGLPGGTGKILRRNAVMLGSVAAAFLVFFAYLLFSRVALDMVILPNYSFPPKITEDGRAVNSYILSLRNTGGKDIALKVDVNGISGSIAIIPEGDITVVAGELKKIPLYITVKDFNEKALKSNIFISVKSIKSDKLRVTRRANFIFP
ncbi:MAG: 4Fe-4S binding protein [Nitrospirae bacterium]|nr:4Fe-4S binding protein [Nitrospirota bacterium]